MKKLTFLISFLFLFIGINAQNSLVKNVPFTNIGPSIMSGRVVDVDVNLNNPNEFYAAYASGGLWYTNNNGTCEENIEPFMVTNNTWYYEFDWLATGTYTILIVPRQNWTITTPTIANYTINLSNGEVVTDRNFWNYKAKCTGHLVWEGGMNHDKFDELQNCQGR
mgnify:CR=1 FL=1